MNDKKTEQPAINNPSGRLRPKTPVARWRRWHFKSSIGLMILGAVAIIFYLLRSGLAKQYEGVGAALCVVACAGFLVWHAIHLFADQDKLDEQLYPDDEKANPAPPPPQPGHN